MRKPLLIIILFTLQSSIPAQTIIQRDPQIEKMVSEEGNEGLPVVPVSAGM